MLNISGLRDLNSYQSYKDLVEQRNVGWGDLNTARKLQTFIAIRASAPLALIECSGECAFSVMRHTLWAGSHAVHLKPMQVTIEILKVAKVIASMVHMVALCLFALVSPERAFEVESGQAAPGSPALQPVEQGSRRETRRRAEGAGEQGLAAAQRYAAELHARAEEVRRTTAEGHATTEATVRDARRRLAAAEAREADLTPVERAARSATAADQAVSLSRVSGITGRNLELLHRLASFAWSAAGSALNNPHDQVRSVAAACFAQEAASVSESIIGHSGDAGATASAVASRALGFVRAASDSMGRYREQLAPALIAEFADIVAFASAPFRRPLASPRHNADSDSE